MPGAPYPQTFPANSVWGRLGISAGPGQSIPFSSLPALIGLAVNVKTFGAKGDGVTDDTVAIQAAISSGATAVYVPASTQPYIFTSLTMPTTLGFVLFGDGTASVLKQTGAGITWPVNNSIGYYEGFIRDLAFNGTSGTGHTIDTSYAGGVSLQNLYFTDVPAGFDSIHIDGSSTTFTHDIRLTGIQIYYSSGGAGHAGIGLGAHCADSQIDDFIMNGGFAVSSCIFIADGALSTRISNSHPYNAKTNILLGSSTSPATGFAFDNVTFDNAQSGNLVSLTNYTGAVFCNCRFESSNSGRSAVSLANCSSTMFSVPFFDGSAGSVSMIVETGTTDYTNVLGGVTITLSSFSAPFNLIGAHSLIKNFSPFNPLGVQFGFSGTTTAAITAGTTTQLGVNGQNASASATAYPVPYAGTLVAAIIAVDVVPGAAQSIAITVKQNSSTIGTGSIGAAAFGVTIALTATVVVSDQIWIQAVYSAGAASSFCRYSVTANG